MDEFRAIDELKYRLMPYVYAQAKDCSEHGLPMVRALFIEYPDDPGSWQVDDEYLFGSQHPGRAAAARKRNRPRRLSAAGQRGLITRPAKSYAGGWQHIEAGKLPVVMLVRDGTVLPHIKLAQSTTQMDWSKLELVVFAQDARTAKGLVCLPSDNVLHELTLTKEGTAFKLANDPLAGKVTWNITRPENLE